jgi:hypothetical protein
VKCLAFFGLILHSALVLAGGGWTYMKGQGFVKLGQNVILANQRYASDGRIMEIPQTAFYLSSVFAEYGISDRVTAQAYIPFFVRNTIGAHVLTPQTEIEADGLNAFGDVDLGIKYGFYKSDSWVSSATIIFGIPSGIAEGGESGNLQTGDGEFNQMIRLDLSRSFGKAAWFSIYAGLNNRTNDFSDEYRFGGEIGTRLGNHFMAIGKLDVVQSFFNGDADPSQGGTIFSNNTEFISPAIELAYETSSEIGFSVSAAGAFAGRNILASPNFGVGVYKKF